MILIPAQLESVGTRKERKRKKVKRKRKKRKSSPKKNKLPHS